jgi:PAS domain S-box-containing protein
MKNEILLANSNEIQLINNELIAKSEELQKANETLDMKVKQRTEELEKANISLKESEERLVNAQKMAHVGSYDWNVATNEGYWSDELYRIFGFDPQFELNHNTFLSRIHPEDLGYVNHAIYEALNGKPYHIDYRIILPDGKERVIHSQGKVIFDEKNTPDRMRGVVQDITEFRKIEEKLSIIETARKREIHHRIKNNLHVISSLLDLQAEKFRNRENIKDSEILEAFRENQDRIRSMTLIHEELYKDKDADNINFSLYIEELTDNLLHIYKRENTEVSFNIDIEESTSFEMDIAVPLGIIVNEIISNSFKHAFIGKDKGEIKIKLWREEKDEFEYILAISDNGVGIPDDLDIKDLNSLGLQLVTTLVDQLDGELEIRRSNGTEFIIKFTVVQNYAQTSAPYKLAV